MTDGGRNPGQVFIKANNMKTKTNSIRLMNDEIFATAVETICNLIKDDKDNFESGRIQYECWGPLGAMSPISRAAFVEEFGEDQTARAEAEARAKLEPKKSEESAPCYSNYSKMADMQNGFPEVGAFVWASCSFLKCDGGDGIFDELRNRYLYEDSDNNKTLCQVAQVFTVSKEEFERPELADSLCKDRNVAGGTAREEEDKDDESAFYTIVAAVTDGERVYYIDSEGFNYARYILLPSDWRYSLNDLYLKVEEEEKRIEEEKEAEEARREEEERKEYEARCAKYEHLMTSTKELSDQIDWRKECGTIRRKIMSIYKKNILAMLQNDFPGVKFSLTSKGGAVSVEWTDGPTEKEVKEKSDLDLFCKSAFHCDPYCDYGYYGTRKYADFAQKYGSYAFGYNDEIRLYRGTSEECLTCALGFISDIAGREVNRNDKISIEEKEFIISAASQIDHNLPSDSSDWMTYGWVGTFGQLAQEFINNTSF